MLGDALSASANSSYIDKFRNVIYDFPISRFTAGPPCRRGEGNDLRAGDIPLTIEEASSIGAKIFLLFSTVTR
jgi:hypothetical protein